MDATSTQSLPTAISAADMSRHPVAAAGKTPAQIRHERLTHEAQRLVSQTFFGTLLRQMRNSPFKSDLFSGGRGGQSFAMIYDQHLADRMARGAGRRLAAGIVRHIERPRSPSQLLHQQSPQPSSPQTPSAGNATTHVSPTH